MAVINNAAPTNDSGNGMGFFLGVALFIIFVVILIYYILPQLQSFRPAPQINIPGQIDVNIKQK